MNKTPESIQALRASSAELKLEVHVTSLASTPCGKALARTESPKRVNRVDFIMMACWVVIEGVVRGYNIGVNNTENAEYQGSDGHRMDI